MGVEVDRSGPLRMLRWGVLLLIVSGVLVVVVPDLLDDFVVAMFGERAPVRTIAKWSLPALDVSFSMPAMQSERALSSWAAEQLANGVYVVGVLIYYTGLAGLAAGGGLIGAALHRLYQAANPLSR